MEKEFKDLRLELLEMFRWYTPEMLQISLDNARASLKRLEDHKDTESKIKEIELNNRVISVCLELLQ